MIVFCKKITFFDYFLLFLLKKQTKMNKNKEIWIFGFALFSLFFGAGNLILPPFLGATSGTQWWLVFFGFIITAVFIPMLGIFAHAKVQGTLYDLGKKVSSKFSSIYCIIIYAIAVTIPAPRTASVTHEMAISPIFNSHSLLTSSIYFLLVFLFVINRSKIISLIGKILTPVIVIILLMMISMTSFFLSENESISNDHFSFAKGVLEGYQTFDAIGGVVVGAVLIISLSSEGYTSYKLKKELITKSCCIAGVGLLMIYGGLIFSGAKLGASFPENASRIEVLTSLSIQTLGNIGTSFLSILVSLACFTTAVGIVTGTSDYVKGVFNNSQKVYVFTAFISSLLGVLIGHFKVDFIIEIAIPILIFIYPITIVLIVLNVISNRFASNIVFRGVVIVTFLFSIPDVLLVYLKNEWFVALNSWIPLSSQTLGWVIPSILTFLFLNLKPIRKIFK